MLAAGTSESEYDRRGPVRRDPDSGIGDPGAGRALGRQIEADYHGKPLTIVAVLTGSLIMLADLIRRIGIPHRVALIQASSYTGRPPPPRPW